MEVRAKKKLGQHFLNDENTVKKIVNVILEAEPKDVLEIGPGTGVLSKYLYQNDFSFRAIEIDEESVKYLNQEFPDMEVVLDDFLKTDISKLIKEGTFIIGNFPYNISSQIFFKVIENRDKVPVLIGMIQKEVAERLSEKEGSKTYGILSVLLQTYYDVEYLFTVNENVFTPPPKVKSAVIKITRNQRGSLPCDEKLYFRLIKESFGQRRKMLRSSLKQHLKNIPDCRFSTQRPEQLSVDDFIEMTLAVQGNMD
jgi:16S rRNA (adenine1518-N6/adenine1519-N6)-dimethyltransferase